MKKYHFLWGLLFSFFLFSCGGSRNVRYVYVTPPQAVAQQSTAPQAANSYTAPAANNYTAQPSPQSTTIGATGASKRVRSFEEIQEAAEADVAGYRGQGIAKSNDYTIAKDLAIARAKSAIIDRAKSAIKDALLNNVKGIQGETISKIERELNTKIIGTMGNYRTVVFYSQLGAINEYAICIEVDRRDVVTNIKEILDTFIAKEQLSETEKAIINKAYNKIQE